MGNPTIENMLHTIVAEYAYTYHHTGMRSPHSRILEAMGRVPRQSFVPEEMVGFAFSNNALPIGLGQTISQPFIVALMTDLLDPGPEDRILEVGTGSGYQAAVLSLLTRWVFSMEIIPNLAQLAGARLNQLGFHNIEVRCDDGYLGWPEQAPFDGIIITAATPNLPEPLLDQLKPGGRMVAPVGLAGLTQELWLVEKDLQGKICKHPVLDVVFVPLTRRGGGLP